MSSPRFPFSFSNNLARRPLLASYRSGGESELDNDPNQTNYESSDTMYTANTHNSFSTSVTAVEQNRDRSNDTLIGVTAELQTINLQDKTDSCSEPEEDQITIIPDSKLSSASLGPRIEKIEPKYPYLTVRLMTALFYGISSFLIGVINKIVLTNYNFPSSNLLGVGQMVAIILIIGVASHLKYVKIRGGSLLRKKSCIWLLAILYLGNLITGLGGTKRLSLPMFIALRRFSIALTAIGEFLILNVIQTPKIILTIITMIGGSTIASLSDLSFDALGYTLVMLNDVFTAANTIFIRKTVNSREINKYELLYYNALITILPLIVISYFTNNKESLVNFPHWTEFGFILCFFLSCIMGFVLMFSTVLCAQHNSALTTTIIGTLKNILTTYVGMFIGGDYVFNALNFIGLNISLVGSLAYSYIVFTRKSPLQESPQAIK